MLLLRKISTDYMIHLVLAILPDSQVLLNIQGHERGRFEKLLEVLARSSII